MILRAPTLDDLDALADLYAAVEANAFGQAETPRRELEQWLTAPTTDLAHNCRLAFDGDRLVAYADVDPVEAAPTRWWSDIRVHPDEDARELVPQLVAWAEGRAAERGGILRIWVPATLTEMKASLAGLGFERVRSSYRMEIELDDDPDVPALDGFEIRTLERGQERVAHAVHQDAFEDSWEHTHEPYDEWEHWLVKTDAYDPSLWFAAWDGERAAGVSLCRDRGGIGWIGVLAVRREWRRRGLGRALLLHSFRELRARGFRRVGLGVDAESLTGANELYESVGMRVTRELEFWDKDVPPHS